MEGFYLMHRGWRENPVFAREPYSRGDAWVWLIEHAAFTTTKVDIAGKTVTIERGQLSYSLRFMAKAWKWDEARVRRFLSRLQHENMISSVTDAGQTVITVCNYERYQTIQCVADAPTDAAPTQHRRSTDAKKNEGNEVKKEEPPVVPQGTKRGSQIPDDFQIDRTFGLKLGFTEADLDFEEGKMRDHFKGTGGVKKDWQATGRVWLRKAFEMCPAWKKPQPTDSPPEDNEARRKLRGLQEVRKVAEERLRQERLAKYGKQTEAA